MEQTKNAGFSVRRHGGVPTLFHGDAPFAAAGYMTYLEPRGHYADFARAGYGLFSFPALCAGKWISVTEGFTPFSKGVFDEKDAPDFSCFDASVRRILAACPGAYLLPRVNLSMPDWWLREHPDLTDGTGRRESLLTEPWLRTAETMLRKLVAHVNESDYRGRIAGYHIAGGNTEEWFHFDMNAGLCPAAEPGFRAYLAERRPDLPFAGLPSLAPLNGAGPCHGDEYLAAYLTYANEAVAQAVARLARAAKEAAGGGVVVGAFFGYALEVASPLYGIHALQTLLGCEDIDFICSPNSYIGVRAPGADWTEMYAADSVRLHGKLCLQECDVRTHLTKPLGECAPRYDPRGLLNAPVWHGLRDRQTAVGQLRKAFCRQLIRGNGFWWFDMWGGWYDDAVLMAETARYREICAESLSAPNRSGTAETAVFADESVFARMTACGARNTAHEQRLALGTMGAPYDMYDIFDFTAVYKKYKAVVFLPGIQTAGVTAAEALCAASGIPCRSLANRGRLFTERELHDFCAESGVHLYCDPGDILYVNARYLALHAVTGGEKTLRFPGPVTLTDLLDGAAPQSGSTVALPMRQGETRLFAIAPTPDA